MTVDQISLTPKHLPANPSRANAMAIITTLYLSAKCMMGTLMDIRAKMDINMEMVIIACTKMNQPANTFNTLFKEDWQNVNSYLAEANLECFEIWDCTPNDSQ